MIMAQHRSPLDPPFDTIKSETVGNYPSAIITLSRCSWLVIIPNKVIFELTLTGRGIARRLSIKPLWNRHDYDLEQNKEDWKAHLKSHGFKGSNQRQKQQVENKNNVEDDDDDDENE